MNVPLVFLPLSLLPPNWCPLLVISYQKVKASLTIINWRQYVRHLGSSVVNKTMQVSVSKFDQILSKESGQNVYMWVSAALSEVLDSFLFIAFPLEHLSVHMSSCSHIHIPTHFQAHISNWSYEYNSSFPLKSALFLLSFHVCNDTATLTQQVLNLILFCFLHILSSMFYQDLMIFISWHLTNLFFLPFQHYYPSRSSTTSGLSLF